MDELLLSPSQGMRMIGVGRSKFLDMIAKGEIESIKIGRLRRIPRKYLEDWVNRQIAEQIGGERHDS